MIQSPQNYAAPQQNNPQQVTRPKRPAFAPSYNAVQINLDTPTLNAPQAGYYYDYPQADSQPYYPPIPAQPAPQALPQPAPNQQPANVPPPMAEQPTPAPATAAPQPADNAPAPAAVDTNAVVANLANPDFDVQAMQMEEIARKGLEKEADAVPYVQEDVFNKLIDIMDVDSSKLAGPTEQQLQLRDKIAENDLTLYNAQLQGKDLNSVKLPHQLTPEEEALATTITPLEQAERNKEYALFTTAILQKTYGDEIEKRSGNVVPLTDLPAAAMVINELKTNPNPAVRTAAIDSLRYIQRPEYKQDLSTIYSIAQSDADEGVAAAAADALNSLNSPEQTAQAA
ncbi:MAG: HEAT repeat domain-containing protein [Candidatus Gastranaerophilales bacterium]|nr:HEAT repeat domain-containing protein [Candidatus Gastranaerophilales bacterium]